MSSLGLILGMGSIRSAHLLLLGRHGGKAPSTPHASGLVKSVVVDRMLGEGVLSMDLLFTSNVVRGPTRIREMGTLTQIMEIGLEEGRVKVRSHCVSLQIRFQN